MEGEETINFYWELAKEADKVDKQLSASYINELLETMKEQNKELPEYSKKLFCLKCFSIFHIGENCKVTTGSCKKHPNTKFIEYHCLCCKNTQRINVSRAKIEKKVAPPPQQEHSASNKKSSFHNQKRRKLLMSILN